MIGGRRPAGPPLRALPYEPGSGTLIVVARHGLSTSDVPQATRDLTSLLRTHDVHVVVCDAGALTRPDVGTVDALAHLALVVGREGRRVHLRRVPAALRELLALSGLCAVLPPDLLVEPEGQTEQREEPLGVEERVERDDPPV